MLIVDLNNLIEIGFLLIVIKEKFIIELARWIFSIFKYI